MNNRAIAAEIEDQHDEIAVEPTDGGQGYWDVYVYADFGYYYDTVPGEVLHLLQEETDVEVYDRQTGKIW